MSDSPNWTEFRKRIFLAKPMNEVYDSWATPNKLATWFLEEAEYTLQDGSKREPEDLIQKNDHHSWKWHNWDFREEGLVLEANGKDHLAFTFGNGGNVHIHLKEVEGGTELELIQNEIPTDDQSRMNYYVGCATGWTFWLTNLKAWLEHGITLNATGLKQSETTHLVNS